PSLSHPDSHSRALHPFPTRRASDLLEPLAEQGKNPAWLKDELEKLNVTKENVFLAQHDDDAQLTIDLYDDNIQTPSPSEKPLLLDRKSTRLNSSHVSISYAVFCLKK